MIDKSRKYKLFFTSIKRFDCFSYFFFI